MNVKSEDDTGVLEPPTFVPFHQTKEKAERPDAANIDNTTKAASSAYFLSATMTKGGSFFAEEAIGGKS